MTTYFRAQTKNISFAKMAKYHSKHHDEAGRPVRLNGLAACISASGLEGGSRFGGAWSALEMDDEIVIFEGEKVSNIYDGFVVKPIREIARFTVREWQNKLNDGSAYDYEAW
jgi:hypothetical protein